MFPELVQWHKKINECSCLRPKTVQILQPHLISSCLLLKHPLPLPEPQCFLLLPPLSPCWLPVAVLRFLLATRRAQSQSPKPKQFAFHGDNNLRTRVNFILNALREMQLNCHCCGAEAGACLVGIVCCKWAQQFVVGQMRLALRVNLSASCLTTPCLPPPLSHSPSTSGDCPTCLIRYSRSTDCWYCCCCRCGCRWGSNCERHALIAQLAHASLIALLQLLLLLLSLLAASITKLKSASAASSKRKKKTK